MGAGQGGLVYLSSSAVGFGANSLSSPVLDAFWASPPSSLSGKLKLFARNTKMKLSKYERPIQWNVGTGLESDPSPSLFPETL